MMPGAMTAINEGSVVLRKCSFTVHRECIYSSVIDHASKKPVIATKHKTGDGCMNHGY